MLCFTKVFSAKDQKANCCDALGNCESLSVNNFEMREVKATIDRPHRINKC